MRLIVTRPQPQARSWAEALRAQGIDARALPLIAIEPALDLQSVRETWRSLDRYDLAVFVSPNAVARFFEQRPEASTWPASLAAAAPGPGTAAALAHAGVARVVEPAPGAPQFDSESLWAVLRADAWQGRHVLVVRGDGGRDWLADQLRGAGAQLTFLQAYRRAVPALDAARQALLDAACRDPERHCWHFSSSQAIDHLERLAVGVDWSRARALATHPRIAARARALGVGDVREVAPALEAVVTALGNL